MEVVMKARHFVCSFLTFVTTLTLAQLNPVPQSFPQANFVGAEVRTALRSPSQRRRAKPLTSTGPEQMLYTFQGGNDGGLPSGNLIFDSSGNLYGTTQSGGGGTCTTNGVAGCGTVFELSPNESGGWTETVLYSFQGGSDGEQPTAG